MQSLILRMKIAVSRPMLGMSCHTLSQYFKFQWQFASLCGHLVYIFRSEGGIPPLVELLKFIDPKVQRAAAGALRTLAFKNDENKNQVA